MEKPLSYRLAVIDLDDTLLGPDKKVSLANRTALQKLESRGVEVVIASGRYFDNILHLARAFDFPGWIIASQGARIQHSSASLPWQEWLLPPALGLEVYLRGRAEKVSMLAYHRSGVFIEEVTEWTRLYVSRAGHQPRQGDLRALTQQGLEKLLWSSAPARIEELEPQLSSEYAGRLYVVETEREIVEFCSVEVNKSHATQLLAQHLQVSQAEIIAFGDGNNDVPLLQWAGCSIAMDHGRKAAKEAARKVTPPGPPEEAFARAVDLVYPD